MTQGGPLLTTILHVVVDAVVCHWESLLAGAMGGDSSDKDEAGKMTKGRMIQGRDNEQRRPE